MKEVSFFEEVDPTIRFREPKPQPVFVYEPRLYLELGKSRECEAVRRYTNHQLKRWLEVAADPYNNDGLLSICPHCLHVERVDPQPLLLDMANDEVGDEYEVGFICKACGHAHNVLLLDWALGETDIINEQAVQEAAAIDCMSRDPTFIEIYEAMPVVER